MVDKFRGWIDDVEHKIKDVFNRKKSDHDPASKSLGRTKEAPDTLQTQHRKTSSVSVEPGSTIATFSTTSSERDHLDPPATAPELTVTVPAYYTPSDHIGELEPTFPTPPPPLSETSPHSVTPASPPAPVQETAPSVLEITSPVAPETPQPETTPSAGDNTPVFSLPSAVISHSSSNKNTSSESPTLNLPLRPSSPNHTTSSPGLTTSSSHHPLSPIKDLLLKSAQIERLLSDQAESQQQNDLSKDVNINWKSSKEQLSDQESDKSEEIRNLSLSGGSDRLVCDGQCKGSDQNQSQNISDSLEGHKDVSVQVDDQTASSKPTLIRQGKVINKNLDTYKHPAIYKRSPSSPCVTLLKSMTTNPSLLTTEPPSSVTVEQSTQNILEALSYKSDPPTTVRKRRTRLMKEPSTESDEEVIRKMRSNINSTRGGNIRLEETRGQEMADNGSISQPLGTSHLLLDHSFTEDSPLSCNPTFAAKIITKFRRSTSDVLENHDAENDPSLSVDILNDKAKEGQPVIPEIKCDIAIRVSSKVRPEVLTWFTEELTGAGLIINSELGCSGDYFIKVTADRHLLLRGAESMELLKRVHPDRGDGMKPFNRNETSLFCPRQSTDGFLSASERQLILYNSINRIRTEEHIEVGGIKFYQHESVVSGLISNNVIKQIYPLHQKSKQNVLNRLWVWNFYGHQPLNLIRHYFGDEIAIYFAWLGYYTTVLVVPLIIGFSIGLFYDDDDVDSADWCFTFYAFFNVVWPTLFLELWKRRSAALAWEWGTLGRDMEGQETQRPQFYGTLGANPVTGEVELQYSNIRRQIKQTVSLFVSVICLFIVLISILAVFRFDDYVQAITKCNKFPDFIPSFLTRFIKYTPKILLPITVGILNALYSNIAVSLNNWENYKHQRTFENWLVLKLILFKFVNSFLALFYIAFYLQDFDKLRETLAALLITKQIVGNCGEILGPTLTSWAKVYLLRRHNSPTEETVQGKLTQVETESEKPRYDSSFDDYLEMFIQMGYVILFSAAYPPAAVWAFLNNIVEIRGDAFKLVNGVQRPFIKRVEDIGFWQDAFEVLSIISIVINCTLIGIRGQVGRWFPNFSTGQQILFVIMMEHVFLSIKYIISRAIPDIPGWVQLAIAKEKYKRDQALKGLEKLMRTARLKGQVQKKVEAMRNRLEEMKEEGRADGVEEQPVQEEQSRGEQSRGTRSRYKIE